MFQSGTKKQPRMPPPPSGADCMGHGGTVSRRTANKKVTKLY